MEDEKKSPKNRDVITLSSGKKLTRKTWIMSTLRRASYRWPEINEAEKAARVERGKYKCAMCEGLFRHKEYAKDHIEPIVPYDGFPIHPTTGGPDWTIIIDRMMCDRENIQILCHSCHDIKTATEDAMRANYNADEKAKEKKLAKEEKKKQKAAKKFIDDTNKEVERLTKKIIDNLNKT